MKKLLITIAIVLMASNCFAWTLTWVDDPMAEGYSVSYKALSDTDYTTVDVGDNNVVDFAPLSLVVGTRYEFYVQAYKGEPKSYSGHSDHLRWTYPADPIIIEYMAPPQNPVINP